MKFYGRPIVSRRMAPRSGSGAFVGVSFAGLATYFMGSDRSLEGEVPIGVAPSQGRAEPNNGLTGAWRWSDFPLVVVPRPTIWRKSPIGACFAKEMAFGPAVKSARQDCDRRICPSKPRPRDRCFVDMLQRSIAILFGGENHPQILISLLCAAATAVSASKGR